MFDSVRRVARAIFVDDIRLRRDGAGVRIELAPPTGEGGTATPERTPPRDGEAARLRCMRSELGAVLGESPGIRRRLQELAYIEQLLGEMGLSLLERAPLAVLAKAQQQLEDQVIDWSPVGLAELRSRMAVAVKARRAQGEREVMPEGAAPAADRLDASVAAATAHAARLAMDASPPAPAAVALESAEDEAALLAAYAEAGGQLPER